MILLIDTTSPTCKLTLVEGEARHDSLWEAKRELAKGLLSHIETELGARQKTFADIQGIGVRKGPGSFTGIRIGLSVLNTMADTLAVPIVGETGDDWQETTLLRLRRGENDVLVMSFYGGEVHISTPRK